MSESTPASATPKDKVARPARRFKWLRRLVIGFVALVTLLALLRAFENWRGIRAWNQYRAAMEASGETLYLKDLMPPPVPEDENFAMTPLLKPLLELNPLGSADRWKDTNGYNRAMAIDVYDTTIIPPIGTNWAGIDAWRKYESERPDFGSWRVALKTDLLHWQAYYWHSTNFPHAAKPGEPAEDVLKALTRFDAELEEIRQAARRPHSRFAIEYDADNPVNILLPHLQVVKKIVGVLGLRAQAELASGRVDQAFEDVQLMLTVADSIKNEPVLISHLVRLACIGRALDVIWEGITDHRWTAPQLERLQKRLARFDFLVETRANFRGERAFGNGTLDWLRRHPTMLDSLLEPGAPETTWYARLGYRLMPPGWYGLEQLNYNRMFDEFIFQNTPVDKHTIHLGQLRRDWDLLEGRLRDDDPVQALLEHTLVVRLLLPTIHRVWQRSATWQASVELFVTGIALERHRLARGQYPDSLEALVPEWVEKVPLDPLDRQPLRYRRLNADDHLLYSIGWNGKNDNGNVVKRSEFSNTVQPDEGDVVWRPTRGEVMRKEKE